MIITRIENEEKKRYKMKKKKKGLEYKIIH